MLRALEACRTRTKLETPAFRNASITAAGGELSIASVPAAGGELSISVIGQEGVLIRRSRMKNSRQDILHILNLRLNLPAGSGGELPGQSRKKRFFRIFEKSKTARFLRFFEAAAAFNVFQI